MRLWIAIAVLAWASAASSGQPEYDEAAELQKLAAAREKWASHDISDYRFRTWVACFCFGDENLPVHVTVNDDRITRAVYAASGQTARASSPVPPDSPTWRRIRTVPQVFELIKKILDERATARLTIKYDDELGFPSVVSLDPEVEKRAEESALYVGDFEATK